LVYGAENCGQLRGAEAGCEGGAGQLQFEVVSNGCTRAADFAVEHRVSEGQCELTVIRTKPDYCRKAKALVDITLDWQPPADCENLDIVFANPEISDFQSGYTRRLPSIKKKLVE